MSRDNTDRSFVQTYRLYLGIAVLAAAAIGFLFLQTTGGIAEDGARITSDKPPMPTTKVELTENKLIEQQALDLDVSLKLSTAHNEIATAQNE